MGNFAGKSQVLVSTDELSAEDWEAMLSSPWRSAVSRELDRRGGLCRAAVRKGGEMSATLGHLGVALANQEQAIETELQRRRQPVTMPANGSKGKLNNTSNSNTPSKKLDAAAARSIVAAKSGSGAAAPDAGDEDGVELRSTEIMHVMCRATGKKIEIAGWRVKIHAARRRAILKVMVMIRLYQGIINPQRCRRVDNWAWAAQNQLGNRLPRYAEDLALCASLRAAIEADKVLLEALCLEIAGAGPDSSRMASMLDLNAPSFTALAAGSVSGLPPAMEALKADSFTGPNRSSFSGFAATGPGANLRRNLVGSGSMSMIAGRGGSVRAVGAAEAAVAALSPHPPLGEAGPSGRHQTLEPLPASRQSSSGALLPNSPLANRARKHLMAVQAENSRARASDPGMLSPRDRDTHTDTGGSSSQHAAFLDSPDLGSAQSAARGLLDSLNGSSSGPRSPGPLQSLALQGPGGKSFVKSNLSRPAGIDITSLPQLTLPQVDMLKDPARSPRAARMSAPGCATDTGIMDTAESPTGSHRASHAGQQSPVRSLLGNKAQQPVPANVAKKPAPVKPRFGFGSALPGHVPLQVRGPSEPGASPHPPTDPPSPQPKAASQGRMAAPPSILAAQPPRAFTSPQILIPAIPEPAPIQALDRPSSSRGEGLPRILPPIADRPTTPQIVSPVLLPRTVLGGSNPNSPTKPVDTQALAYLDMDEGLLDKKAQARLRLARIRRGDMLHNTPDNTNTHTKTHTELTSGPSDTHTSTHAAPSDPRLPVASLQHTQTHTQTQALGESLGLGEGQTVFARQVSDLDKEADTSNGQSNGFGAGTTDDDGSTAQGDARAPGTAETPADSQWKAQLIQELEALDKPAAPPPLPPNREEIELARLVTTQDAKEQAALEAIQAAARKAQEALLASTQTESASSHTEEASHDDTHNTSHTQTHGPESPGTRAAREQARQMAERISALTQKLQANVAALRAAEGRLLMHINSTNRAWAESQRLVPPDLWADKDLNTWLASSEAAKYRQDMCKKILAGQVAVHINAFEDYVWTPNTGMQNVWCCEPWSVLSAHRPGLAIPTFPASKGLSWGARALLQLVAALQATAAQTQSGASQPEDPSQCLSRVWVVVALDDEMQHSVLKEMWARRFYGFQRERVLFTMQTRRAGCRWDPSNRLFVEDDLGEPLVQGAGVSFMQLSWACEAFILSPEGSPSPIKGSVIELLEDHSVEWLVSRRARDLGLVSRDTALPVQSLAYALYLRERANAGMVMGVHHVKDVQTSRAMNSIILGAVGVDEAWRTKIGSKALAQLPLSSHQSVIELSHLELQGAEFARELARLHGSMGGKLAVSCGRDIYHLPTLKSVIATPNVFRPKLHLVQETLTHVTIEISDLTTAPAMRCMGMTTKPTEWFGVMSGEERWEELASLLQTQDDSPDFRKLVCQIAGALPVLAMTPVSAAAAALARSNLRSIVVFVSQNRVSQTALEIACSLAKEGRDIVRVVAFVSSDLAKQDHEELMIKLHRACARPGLSVVTEVMVRGESGLLDCMEQYLLSTRAHMAVMGSSSLGTGQGAARMVIGSITLALLRRVTVPVLVVTPNSAKHAGGLRSKLRLGVFVETSCRSTHDYLCTSLADASRGDHLVYVQKQSVNAAAMRHPAMATAATGQSIAQKRLLDSLHSTAKVNGVPVQRSITVEGPIDTAILEAVDTSGINVLGLTVPGHNVPQWVLNVLSGCKGAVLLVHPSTGNATTL